MAGWLHCGFVVQRSQRRIRAVPSTGGRRVVGLAAALLGPFARAYARSQVSREQHTHARTR